MPAANIQRARSTAEYVETVERVPCEVDQLLGFPDRLPFAHLPGQIHATYCQGHDDD